jgi:hypothetical protein
VRERIHPPHRPALVQIALPEAVAARTIEDVLGSIPGFEPERADPGE